MNRRLSTIAVACVAALTGAAYGVINAGAQNQDQRAVTPERCTPPKSKGRVFTVLSNEAGRVWGKRTVRGNTVYDKYYACSNAYRRHVYLATGVSQDLVDEGDSPAFSRVTVTRDSLDIAAVAFTKIACPAGEDPARCSHYMRWQRLRDRKVLREFRAQGLYMFQWPVVFGEGSLFYTTQRTDSRDCDPACEVRRHDGSNERVIDRGARIGPLSLGPGAVFWLNGTNAKAVDFSVDNGVVRE